MTQIYFQGKPIQTSGDLPNKGEAVKDFTLVMQDLSEKTLESFPQKRKVLNIFPSLDTGVCASSVRQFYKKIPNTSDVVVLNISKDLPFAHARFCVQEGFNQAITLSAFRSSFAKDYGLEILDGPLKGLCSRVVIVLDEKNRVLDIEQVPEITQEPDYDRVLAHL